MNQPISLRERLRNVQPEEAVGEVLGLKYPQGKRVLITIDGPCASGKITMAEELAAFLGAFVLHTDDFVVPHAQKTPERLAVPGGNCDWERLGGQVIAPWKAGLCPQYQRYDCRRDCFLPAESLDAEGVLILEGSYCNLPVFRTYADLRLFMAVPEVVRMERLRQRESPESLRMFYEKWIPLENAYFSAFLLPDEQCVLIC